MANKKAKGKRAKTRRSHRSAKHARGINRLIRRFEPATPVTVHIDPAVHAGLPFRRFHGAHGVVLGMRGRAVEVRIRDQGKPKTLVVAPAHLKTVKA